MPEIEVTFELDSNGILNVHAKDRGTGKAHSAKIVSGAGLAEADVAKMVTDAEQYRSHDRERRAATEARNRLDGLLYTTRRSLDEYGTLVSAQDHAILRDALYQADRAMDGGELRLIAQAHEALAMASQRLAESIYAAARNAPTQEADDDMGFGTGAAALPATPTPRVTLDIGTEIVDDE